MKINSDHLEAFYVLARTRSFTKAAKELFISQSALSQRIHAFETKLNGTLFIRAKKEARLTELGLRILRYCQVHSALEDEVLSNIQSTDQKSLTGTIRIGASSSHMRSLVIPALSNLSQKNPKTHFIFLTRQIQNLSQMLFSGEVDFILLDEKLNRAEVINEVLGEEEFVIIRNKKLHSRSSLYLGTEIDDQTMSHFRALQTAENKKGLEEFSFVGDVYGILDAVIHGYGSAITSKHTIPTHSAIEIDKSYKTMKLPILLTYFSQNYFSQLHQSVVSELKEKIPKLLK